MKIIAIALLTLSLVGCSDYLYKKNEDNYWKQLTPQIGDVIK